MSKAKIYYKEIRLIPLNITVDVIVSKDFSKVYTLLEKMTDGTAEEWEENIEGYDSCLIQEDAPYLYIKIVLKGFNIPAIVHECTHAVWYALDSSGVKVDVYNHEIQAYFMEYLTKEILLMKCEGYRVSESDLK